MTPADAADLLTIAAAFDRRKIGHTDALAWAKALEGLDVRDCAAAIAAHFSDSTEYLMPAHVRAGVKRIRAERIRAVSSDLLEPDNVDPADPIAYLEAARARRRLLADGGQVTVRAVESVRRPVAELVEATAKRMPTIPGGAS